MKRRHKSTEDPFVGKEPIWNPKFKSGNLKGKDLEHLQLGKMFNYYNYLYDWKTAKKWVIEYMRHKKFAKSNISKIDSLKDNQMVPTVGWLSKIALNAEDNFPKHLVKILTEKIDKYVELADNNAPKVRKVKVVKEKTVQDYIKEKVLDIIGEIEGDIDDFITNKFKTKKKNAFSLHDYLKDGQVKDVHCKRVADHYKKYLKELTDARDKKDPQLVEGYDHLTKAQMKNFIALIQSYIADAEAWKIKAKQIKAANRKPRAKKRKTPAQLVAKMNYLKADKSIGLRSVDPEKIIGAEQVWVFNTKYRKLGVYHACSPHGLSVKGSTIIDFDMTKSVEKKLRKPKEVITNLLEAGKVAIRKTLTNINAKEKNLTGRMNANVIIVRVL